jgi:outer membrane protein assembly factor BamB
LRINGAVASANQERLLELQGGGRIEFGLKSYTIHLPDSSSISVTVRGSHLNAYLSPAAGRAGTLSGLFGNFDGDASNDLRTAAGTLLEAPISAQQIYDEFGASWRISQGESLFDYADGQTTATFADLEFPYQPSGLQDLSAAERERAEKICRDTGISNADILEGCIVDVGYSGDQVFAESALDAQAVDAEAAGIGPKPVVSGLCEPDSAIAATSSYRGNVARSGRTDYELPELRGTVAWSANRFRSNKEPIFVDGKVIGPQNNKLAALDAITGEVLWESEGSHGRIAGRGLLAAGGALFAAWNDAFAAYDLGSGEECWHLPVTTPTSATFAKNRLFIGVDEGATGYVAAIDARNGQMLWRYDTQNTTPANWSNPSEPALDDDMLFFADGDDLVALDAATGSELWRSAQGENVSDEIAADDGVIYVPLRSLGLEAIDAATGKSLWSWRESRAYVGSPAVGRDNVYVSDYSHLHAIDRESGTVVWSSDEQQREKFASPTLAGNRLFTASTSNELVILDAGSGEEVQRLPLTHRGSSYPVVPLLAEGRVYLVLSGVLQAYE